MATTGSARPGAGARAPPLDLRANTLKATRPGDRRAEGTGAAPTAIATHGIRIPPIDGAGRHPNVQAEPAFQKGWFEVQDEGSQVAAELAGATSAMQVLDFCAGAGGKTLALSAVMENHGQIFAHDSDKSRIAPIFDRIRRSENRNVQVVTKPGELAGLADRMDLVVVDAPCTGSGTWRRRPDAKWRLTRRQLDARLAEQAAILQDAARFVKPGGRLVYITCSVFPEENHQLQIARFLEGNRASSRSIMGLFEAGFPGKSALARIGPITADPVAGAEPYGQFLLRRAAAIELK